ncbi:MAG: cytochrome c [Bacteroidia bacterium]
MDRYTMGFLFLVGWFVCFRMFPWKVERMENDTVYSTISQSQYNNTYSRGYSNGPSRGRDLFNANCARCHNAQLQKKGTGPALYGVSARKPAGDWIYRWVKNSAKMIQEGDAYAVKIWKENGKAAMDPFPSLSEQQIDTIMAWIDGYSFGPVCSLPAQ